MQLKDYKSNSSWSTTWWNNNTSLKAGSQCQGLYMIFLMNGTIYDCFFFCWWMHYIWLFFFLGECTIYDCFVIEEVCFWFTCNSTYPVTMVGSLSLFQSPWNIYASVLFMLFWLSFLLLLILCNFTYFSSSILVGSICIILFLLTFLILKCGQL